MDFFSPTYSEQYILDHVLKSKERSFFAIKLVQGAFRSHHL